MKQVNRRGLFLVVLVQFFITACFPEAVNHQKELNGPQSVQAVLSRYEKNLVVGYRDALDQYEDATRYMIDLVIGDRNSEVIGEMEVSYSNTETISLNELYFRLFPNVGIDYLTVNSILLDGQEIDFAIGYEGTAVRLDLPQPLSPGESVTVDMEFSQNVPETMGGNYGLYVYTDGVMALDNFFPIIPVYDQEGWNVEEPPRNADMVFTDVSFFEVSVNAPEDWVLVTSGVEVDRVVKEGRAETRFVGGPQRDFYIAASPRFVSETRQVGDTMVRSFFPPEFKDDGLLVLDAAAEALDIFSERYGEYPYTELDLVSTPMLAGGMEYSGVAAMSLDLYESETLTSGIGARTFLELATAHEVAHQWFFNLVMNDQIDEPWLDEGFAQYSTYIYYLDRYGSSAAQSYIEGDWERRWDYLGREEIPIGKAAGEYTNEQYGPIIYARAPIFISLLEERMGTDTFSQFLKDYVNQYRWQTVDTDDFRTMAEETCSCDLEPLFKEWVYGD